MAITTVDGVIAGMRPPEHLLKVGGSMEGAGILHSLMYVPGRPGAALAPSSGINGTALTSYPGQIPWTNPASGNSYLARLQASSSSAGCLLLLDRLWHNSGIVVTTTTSQAITSPTWPARSADGTTNGEGVMVAIEVSTSTTNAGAITNTTLTYTNQAGTGSRTATIASFPATAVTGAFIPFQLAPGDTGIRSVQGITLGTSYAAGAIHLVAYRQIATLELPLANTGSSIDAITSGFPRLFNDSVMFLAWLPTGTSAITVAGAAVFTQG